MRLSVLSILAYSIVYLSLAEGALARVIINEFMASNQNTWEDPNEPGSYDDWIELYNSGDSPADLSGMYLTDDLERPTRWQFPTGTRMDPGEYLLVVADGEPEQGSLHADFKLKSDGEEIALFGTDGVALIDSTIFGPQESDVSYGRFPNGEGAWQSMPDPTPGTANRITSISPVFSESAGAYYEEDPPVVSIDSGSPEATIYYTVDGSAPTPENGIPYTGEMVIDKSTWLRAIKHEPGREISPETHAVYMIYDRSLRGGYGSRIPLIFIDTFGYDIGAEATLSERPYRPVMTVFIDTPSPTTSANITQTPNYVGYAAMHVRGYSSRRFEKKQYAFEVRDENDEDRNVSLLGLPSESDWILGAPYADKSLIRNYLAYKWSNDIGRYAPRTRFAHVFIHEDGNQLSTDDYEGVYLVTEKIKRDDNRVSIRKLEPSDSTYPDISGGYILRRDWENYGDVNDHYVTEIYGDILQYRDPSADRLTNEQREWIETYINDFEAVLDEPYAWPRAYEEFIDVDSFADHHLLVEMMRNGDGYNRSTFMFKDRRGKLNMGPLWDYNMTLGGFNHQRSHQVEGWHASNRFRYPAGNHWYDRLLSDQHFLLRCADRWFEFREDQFSVNKLHRDIDDIAGKLTANGASFRYTPVYRNFARWDILGKRIFSNADTGDTYKDEIDYIKDWLKRRVAWMDGAIAIDYAAAPPAIHINGQPGNRNAEIEGGSYINFLSSESGSGVILYTLDGTDPRSSAGGSISYKAIQFDGMPFQIHDTVQVHVRLYDESTGQWSALNRATLTVAP